MSSGGGGLFGGRLAKPTANGSVMKASNKRKANKRARSQALDPLAAAMLANEVRAQEERGEQPAVRVDTTFGWVTDAAAADSRVRVLTEYVHGVLLALGQDRINEM